MITMQGNGLLSSVRNAVGTDARLQSLQQSMKACQNAVQVQGDCCTGNECTGKMPEGRSHEMKSCNTCPEASVVLFIRACVMFGPTQLKQLRLQASGFTVRQPVGLLAAGHSKLSASFSRPQRREFIAVSSAGAA